MPTNTFSPPLTSLLPLHEMGKKGGHPLQHSRDKELISQKPLALPRLPASSSSCSPSFIIHHLLVGCSLGLRANKHFAHMVLSVQHLAFPVLVCLPECLLVNSSAKEHKSKIIKQCSHDLIVTQQLGLATTTRSSLA